ncbi:type VI secretion system membrane subunit TssM [Ramlibacter sp.]|uniref:type VI secretion system membrane subunit TssM n=1 Tax=Ramlibacter sp. TaxID=1917967 RepID=UPI002D736B5E|nr:type VI secretion system membrane subunit TssM [Ramlibacter sp.]HYD75473.1 type VI secretion system membrane subunit TssM [Ramlibacter sp.]
MSALPWKRWLIGAVIVLVLALLVWFAGPLVAIGQTRIAETSASRWILIGLVVLAWLLIEAGRVLLERRRNKKLIEDLAKPGEDESISREEAQVLGKRFAEALEVLKSAKLGGGSGSRMLYQLPWYMFIGAPGSGKTTALVNCGLRFPLAAPGSAGSAVGGIGGTRNCDWWFTDRAVLIDTAGRYTTHDSNEKVDRSAWTTFLQLLKRHRPRQPISGIMVTLSVSDLLGFSPQERQRYAQVVRARVDELQRELGLQFPVYVLVTKCDLVAGFSEFFSTFDAEQRAQVWGITFDLDIKARLAENAREGFDREFPALLARLNDLLLARLQDERDPERRIALYPFPQQFAAIGPLVSEFLSAAFGDSTFTDRAMVRGVYFTSGTQQGAPIDRLLGSLASSLNFSASSASASRAGGAGVLGGAAKSFFLTRLMSEVIFPEAGLAGHSEQRETRLRRLNWAMVVGTALLATGLVAAWTVSYFGNKAALADAAGAARKAKAALDQVGPPSPSDLPVLVSALGTVKAVPLAVHDPVEDPPLRMEWGLYQGDSVKEQVDERYRHALQQGLLPRIALQLETIMGSPRVKPEAVYAALKAYLMMYDMKRLHQPFFVATIVELWHAAGIDREMVAVAREHLEELVRSRDLQVARFHPLDEAVVAAARDRVAAGSMIDRAYSLMRLSGGGGPGIRLSEVVGPAGVGVLQRASGVSLAEPIDYIFTREGYLKAVRPRIKDLVAQLSAEEAWVMGPRASGLGRASSSELESAVLQRFLADYRATWEGVLRDVQVRRIDGIRTAMSVSQVLGQSDSPLKRLVALVAEQTRLTSQDAATATASAATEAAKARIRDTAARETSGIFGSGSAAVFAAAIPGAQQDPIRAQELALEEQFASVRRLAGDGKGPAEIDAAIALINDIFNELVALQQRLGSGQGLKEMPPALGKAKAQADRFGVPVAGAIKSLVDYAGQEASGGVRREVKAGVGGASAMCQRAIPGRYPFVRASTQDTGVQDFVNVFKAGGDLDAFFNANLASYVDKSGGVWRLKGSGEGAPPVSAATLRQFQNADAIRTAFLNGGAAPAVTVDVSLLSGDGEVAIEYDGAVQKLRVGSGSARLAWPAKPGARLTVNGQQAAAAEGAWALFRLVDKGTVDPASTGDRLRVSYAAGASRALLELRTGSAAFNPFRLRELEAFSCPRE